MESPFKYRRDLKQELIDQDKPVDSGILGDAYKADPTSWKNQFVSRMKTNKGFGGVFDEQTRAGVIGNQELFDGRPQFGDDSDNAVANDFLTKYLQSNIVEPNGKITQVTARQFVEQDPKQGLAGTFPQEGVATS